MSRSPDLVSDSELLARIEGNDTVHTFNEVADGRRRVTRIERWAQERYLGEGGFGQVWLEKCTQGKSQGTLRAVKIIRKQRNALRSLNYNRELEAVAKFSHQRYEACFVKSFGWYQTADTIHIAMEYLPLGDLHVYLAGVQRRLPEKQAQTVTHQLLEGLDYMHSNGFAHRDVKPGNILIKAHPPDEWWVKLSDFGISRRAEAEHGPSTVKGTPGFMAPELQGFRDKSQDGEAIDFQAADIWALGEVSFRMLNGGQAFPDPGAFAYYCLGQGTNPSEQLKASVSEHATNFLASLIAVRPHVRPTARAALAHPWLSSLLDDFGPRGQPLGSQGCSNEYPNTAAADSGESLDRIMKASKSWGSVSERQHKPTPHLDVEEQLSQSKAMGVVNNILPSSEAHWKTCRVEPGYPDCAYVVSFSPDGQSFVSSHMSEEPVQSLSPQKLPGHGGWAWSVTYSPDGRRIAWCGLDCSVKLFNAQYGTLQQTIRLPYDPLCVAFSRDGKRLAFSIMLQEHTSIINKIAFAPDGKAIASVSKDTIGLWTWSDALVNDPMHRLHVTRTQAMAVTFSPDGRVIAWGFHNHTIELWSRHRSRIYQVQRLRGHEGPIESLAFSPDGATLASASLDATIRLWAWNGQSATLSQTLRGHKDVVKGVAFSADGKTIASTSLDGTIRLWQQV